MEQNPAHRSFVGVRPATLVETVVLAAVLITMTVPIAFFEWKTVNLVQQNMIGPVTAHVGDLSPMSMDTAPAALMYDKIKGDLIHLGPVDDEIKRTLTAVARTNSTQQDAVHTAYLSGIDKLAFETLRRQSDLTQLLLLLGGLAGALGVQLRSLTNFVGHACFANDLDIRRWWPYYAIRPFTGFILGTALIAVVQSGLISLQSTVVQRVLWWAALAFLAGFGEEEFTQRLRLVSKTIFGEKSDLTNKRDEQK